MPQVPLLTFTKGPTGVATPLASDATGGLAGSPTGGGFANIVGANAGVALKNAAGVLRGLTVNTAGTGSTLVLYDGTSTAGIKIGTFSTVAQANFAGLNIRFATGLFAVATGTVADVTLSFV